MGHIPSQVTASQPALPLHLANTTCQQGMAFSVAMNSKRANAIVALLIASNFAEIKGVVFKRFDARRLLILSCMVTRLLTCVRHMHDCKRRSLCARASVYPEMVAIDRASHPHEPPWELASQCRHIVEHEGRAETPPPRPACRCGTLVLPLQPRQYQARVCFRTRAGRVFM